MEENSKNNKNSQLGIGIILRNSSLKFWEEDMIRSKMRQSEKLIRFLKSREFQVEFNIGEKWFDDAIELIIKECKEHLVNCAERLVRSKNYH